MGVEQEAKFLVPSVVFQTHWIQLSRLEEGSWLRTEPGKESDFPFTKRGGTGGKCYKDWYVTLGSYGTSLGLDFHMLKVGMTIAPRTAVLKIRWHHVSTVPGTEPGPRGSSMNKLSEQEPLLPMSMLSSSVPIPTPESFPTGNQCSNPLAAKQSCRTHLWRVEEQI